jgi:hypothetical protein
MVMNMITEYRRKADECERLAETATSAEQRRSYLEFAASWRALAEERKHGFKLTVVGATRTE